MQDLIPPHPYSPDATKYNFPLSTSRFGVFHGFCHFSIAWAHSIVAYSFVM
ncbi:hypothetical protein E1A91_D04G129900v1 [Gossypium mustelinum]|uniref:Uncharacterized protein n=1 Tax=Gossypium mustelinum TaxID=34275 RepID=A0A5D2VDB1_GOSMU|nr:hypothetical protein E1A91_D04G129900v1 [Gossypium mustelinum]